MRPNTAHRKKVIISVLITAAAALCSLGIDALGIEKESVIMVFLMSVLFSAVLTGSYLCGIITSFFSLFLYNFLFTAPRFTTVISGSSDIMLLLFFLATAAVSGSVTSRLRQQMQLAGRNEQAARTLYRIASGFLSASGQDSILNHGADFIRDYAGAKCCVRIDGESPAGEWPDPPTRDFPIVTPAGRLGTLTVGPSNVPQAELVIQAVATQLGIALDREYLSSERERITVAIERERQRSALLRSVAHDLRSPLTALSGESNLLADSYDTLSDDERRKLAVDMSEEIIWLTDLVENILSMTRISESQLVLHKEDEVIDDIVSAAAAHTKRLMGERSLTVSLPDEVLCVPMDGRLVVQAITNLLENAALHTPPDASVTLSVSTDAEKENVVIAVADTGKGVNPRIRNKLFERFVTLDEGIVDGQRGLGLGLSICKAIVEAHGGSVAAEDNLPRGARFILTLPLTDRPPKGAADEE